MSLSQNDLLVLTQMQPAGLRALVESRLADAREALQAVESTQLHDWEHIVAPLDDRLDLLHQAWNIVVHLLTIADSEELRAVYNSTLDKLSSFAADMAQSLPLYARYRSLADSDTLRKYDVARRRVVESALRNFHLGGVDLPDDKRRSIADIRRQLASLSAQYDQNLLDATQSFSLYVDDEETLHGIPVSVLTSARAAAERKGQNGWLLTLDNACVWGILDHCEHRPLREQIYRAFQTRCSERGPPAVSNAGIITAMLSLRAQLASLLGFASYAHCVMTDRMIKDPAQALGFLRDLAARLRPAAEAERAAMKDYARAHLGLETLEPWDAPFVVTRMRTVACGWSSESMRSYLPEDAVLAALYRLLREVYGVETRPGNGGVWHSDVRHLQLFDEYGSFLGDVYVDLHAREGKRGGSWVREYRPRRAAGNAVQTPIVFLCCNFGRGRADQEIFLNHDDVVSLFHEFGHCLHHVLTEVDELGVSGVNGVERDGIELPSQLMENFAWERQTLAWVDERLRADRRMPPEVIGKLRAARNFHSALTVMRQIELSLIDMELHSRPPTDWPGALGRVADIRAEIGLFPAPDDNRFLTSFNHIFSSGYAAGYYAYVWSEVISADAYAGFEDADSGVGAVGRSFRREVLARGGSRPLPEGVHAFLGKTPDSTAFLRARGLAPGTG